MGRLDGLVQDAVDGRLGVDDALVALREIQSNPLRRPWPIAARRLRTRGCGPDAAARRRLARGDSRRARRARRRCDRALHPANCTGGADDRPDRGRGGELLRRSARSRRLRCLAGRRHACCAGDTPAGHDAHDRDAGAVDAAPPVGGRQHGERPRAAPRARLRRRGRSLDRHELVRRGHRGGSVAGGFRS